MTSIRRRARAVVNAAAGVAAAFRAAAFRAGALARGVGVGVAGRGGEREELADGRGRLVRVVGRAGGGGGVAAAAGRRHRRRRGRAPPHAVAALGHERG